jgi:hypothetical protein
MTQIDKQTISEIRAFLEVSAQLDIELSFDVRSTQNSHERTNTDAKLSEYIALFEDKAEGWLRALLAEHDAHEAASAREADVFGAGG